MARVLVIDVGNSRVAAALWTATPGASGGAAADATPGGAPAGTVRRLREWPTPRDAAARTVLAGALAVLAAAEGTTGAAIVSVVPTCGAALLAALPGAVPARPHLAAAVRAGRGGTGGGRRRPLLQHGGRRRLAAGATLSSSMPAPPPPSTCWRTAVSGAA